MVSLLGVHGMTQKTTATLPFYCSAGRFLFDEFFLVGGVSLENELRGSAPLHAIVHRLPDRRVFVNFAVKIRRRRACPSGSTPVVLTTQASPSLAQIP